MGRYCTSSQCVDRYNRLITIANSYHSYLESNFVFYAENELDQRLSAKFTVPFSSNNVTARDLSIDITYCRAGNLKAEERKEICGMVDDTIDALLDGKIGMMTDSGDVLNGVGGTVWSNTQGYHPVFGMDDIINAVVDSAQICDERDERGEYC